jgi:hypothetical protein
MLGFSGDTAGIGVMAGACIEGWGLSGGTGRSTQHNMDMKLVLNDSKNNNIATLGRSEK